MKVLRDWRKRFEYKGEVQPLSSFTCRMCLGVPLPVGRGSRSRVSGADQWGWHESLRNRVTSSQYFMPSSIKSKPKNPQHLSLFLIFNSVASPVPSSHFTCLQLKKKYRQGEESKLPGKYPGSTGRADASSRTSAPLWLTDQSLPHPHLPEHPTLWMCP